MMRFTRSPRPKAGPSARPTEAVFGLAATRLLVAVTALGASAAVMTAAFVAAPAGASVHLVQVPVSACPVPAGDYKGTTISPSRIPPSVGVPFRLPPGTTVFGADMPTSATFMVAPLGLSCTAAFGADGGESMIANGPKGSGASVTADFFPGGINGATALGCQYIPAVVPLTSAAGLPPTICTHPGGETIYQINTGTDAGGAPITDGFIALVEDPPGTLDPWLAGSGGAYPTYALFTTVIYTGSGGQHATGQSIECTLPPGAVTSCAAALGEFLYESDVANGLVTGHAMADPGAAIAEVFSILDGANSQDKPWSSSIPTPGQAFSDRGRVIANVAIAAAGAILITFPAQLFNLTFEENYPAIMEWVERRRASFRRLTPRRKGPPTSGEPAAPAGPGGAATRSAAATPDAEPPPPPAGAGVPPGKAPAEQAAPAESTRLEQLRTRRELTLVIAVGALLGSLLDPSFGIHWRSVDHYIAVFLALAAGLAVAAGALHVVRRWQRWESPLRLHALPLGLVVALGCVLVSRLANFQPGYLYGVVCGAALTRQLTDKEEGQIAAFAIASTLAASILSWLIWVPVHGSTTPGSFFGLIILDGFFSALFVSGFVGATISLLPLRFLPGHTIMRWNRPVWALLWLMALFGVVDFLVRSPVSPGASHSPLVTTIVLFVLFAGASMLFRDHFIRKWRAEHHVEVHGFGPRLRDIVRPRPTEEPELLSVAGAGQIVLEERVAAQPPEVPATATGSGCDDLGSARGGSALVVVGEEERSGSDGGEGEDPHGA